MKIQFSIWACLVLFVMNSATAAISIPTNSNPKEAEKVSKATTKSSAKETVEILPGRELQLVVNNNTKALEVNLTGKVEKLEWVIFQPKGKVVSRISTSSKIDKIKVDNLTSGKYVLMIRDDKKRMIYKHFELN